jgi:hypothetical protein
MNRRAEKDGGFLMKKIVLLAAIGSVLTGVAGAQVLGPGQTAGGFPGILTYGGSVLATTTHTITPIGPVSDFTATYTETVYSDPNNLFGAGDLDFVISVTNSANSSANLERVTNGAFRSFETLVGYADEGGAVPSDITRSLNAPGVGNTIGFDFSGADNIMDGQKTDDLIIQTNATNYTIGSVAISNDVSAFGPGFAPTACPEPASLSLFGGGLFGLGMLAYRRKKA